MALSAFELCEDTFGMSRDDLESIIAFLRSAESRQMSHSDVEKLVRERSYELSRKLFQAHVDSRGPGEAAAPVRGADGVERDQERIHERGLTTIFGEIRVKRFGYGAEGADSLHPLDAELNLPRERYSFELRRTAAVEVSKGAFDEAVASLGRHTGAKVGKRQVEELAGRAAEDFDAFYGQRAPPAGDRSASVLAITADGKGVVMLRKDLREATKKAAEKGSRRLGKRLTKGEKRNRKRMATVAAVYTVEPFVRQPEDVVRVLAPSDEREKDKRPRPQDKRVWASLAKEPEEVLEEAFAEAERRDPSHRKSWVALVDGNATQLKILHKLAGQHHVELTIVLDFIHVCEYVWKASLGFYEETEPARQVWVQERLLRILRGEACLVAAGIRRSATRRKLTPDNRENVDQCADYLLNHASYLHYDECLAAGFPIATGVIEGACRHLVSDRMDLTGARWSLAGAEAVLRLRALRSSGDFDEYWRFHEQCEYERNHASRYADGKVVPVKGRQIVMDVRFVGSKILVPGVYYAVRLERVLVTLDQLGGALVILYGELDLTVARAVSSSKSQELVAVREELEALGEHVDGLGPAGQIAVAAAEPNVRILPFRSDLHHRLRDL